MLLFALLLIPIMLSLDLNKYVRVAVWAIIAWTTILGIYSAYHNRVWKRYLHDGKKDYEHQWVMGKRVADIVQDGETVFIPHAEKCYIYYTANLMPADISKYGYAVGPMEIDITKAFGMIKNANYVIHLKTIYEYDFEYYYNDSNRLYVDQYPSDTLDAETIIQYLNRPKLNDE